MIEVLPRGFCWSMIHQATRPIMEGLHAWRGLTISFGPCRCVGIVVTLLTKYGTVRLLLRPRPLVQSSVFAGDALTIRRCGCFYCFDCFPIFYTTNNTWVVFCFCSNAHTLLSITLFERQGTLCSTRELSKLNSQSFDNLDYCFDRNMAASMSVMCIIVT